MTFNWIHFLLMMVGCFVGSFLYNVWKSARNDKDGMDWINRIISRWFSGRVKLKSHYKPKFCFFGCDPLPRNIVNYPHFKKVRIEMHGNDFAHFYVHEGGGVTDYLLVADSFDGPWRLEPNGKNFKA